MTCRCCNEISAPVVPKLPGEQLVLSAKLPAVFASLWEEQGNAGQAQLEAKLCFVPGLQGEDVTQ